MGSTTIWILAGIVVSLMGCASATWTARLQRRGREFAQRGAALEERDDRLLLRESTLETKARTLELREANLLQRERALGVSEAELEDLRTVARKRLEEIADYTSEEARQALLDQAEADTRAELRALVRESEERAQAEADQRAQAILATAVQRTAVAATAGRVTTSVHLPSDDLKGRIVGRDGRNIRAFEQLSGVDVIVDELPGAVLLSSFDPLRREVARRALTELVQDGRIQPAAIERALAEARREVDRAVDEAGAEAAREAGVEHLPPELCRLLGQLEFRFSYGQNVRLHSIETAVLAGLMADELGADGALARRCGLLHDIGKALTHRVQGSHAQVGAEVARRLGESEEVCHAIAAHHGEVRPVTIAAVLTQAADAVSASRPGARRDGLEQHCTRLRRIEEVCAGFAGVEQAFVMQSGREVRVMVHPEAVDDAGVQELSHAVAARIQEEVAVPGPVTVTVIRELRARTVAPRRGARRNAGPVATHR